MASISYRELRRWMEFDAIDPFGDRRGDARVAMLLTQTANLNRDAKKRPKPYGISEFMYFDRWREQQQKRTAPPPDEGARISGDTLAFLAAAAQEAGHKVNFGDK